MAFNKEIRAAFNERQKYLNRLTGLAMAAESCRENFSSGEDWQPGDDKICSQIEAIHGAMIEAAAALTRADMTHRCAMEQSTEAITSKIDD